MFSNLPDNQKITLERKLNSRRDDSFLGAFFELILHEWLLAQGHKVIAFEPQLKGTKKTPDFLVESSNGEKFYIEAKVKLSSEYYPSDLITKLDSVESGYHFHVNYSGKFVTTPSFSKIAKQFQDWILKNKLDAETDINLEDIDDFRWSDESFELIIKPTERKSEKSNSTIISMMPDIKSGRGNADLDKLLNSKLGKFGQLEHPYLIAVGTQDWYIRMENLREAVFGTMAIRFTPGNHQTDTIRNDDGIWVGPGYKEQNKRVSGIFLLSGINPWHFTKCVPIIFLNPWANKPVTSRLLDADCYEVRDDMITKVREGQTLGDICQFSPPFQC